MDSRELEHPDLHIHLNVDEAFECLEHYLSHKLSYREGEKERAFSKIVLDALKRRFAELACTTTPPASG